MTTAPRKVVLSDMSPTRGDMNPDILRGASNNDMAEVKAALARDPHEINRQDREFKDTALHIAGGRGNLTMVNFLLTQPHLQWGIKDIRGFDPLDVAILAGNPDVIKALMRHRSQLIDSEYTNKSRILPFEPL